MQGVSTEIPESPDALQSWENSASWGEEGPNSSLTPPCSPSCPLSSGILKAVPESRLASGVLVALESKPLEHTRQRVFFAM